MPSTFSAPRPWRRVILILVQLLPLSQLAGGWSRILERALGFEESEPFFEEKGSLLGRRALADVALSELIKRLEKVVAGPVKTFASGPKNGRTIGVITGAAGSEIERVAAEGIDTFITGEAPHWA